MRRILALAAAFMLSTLSGAAQAGTLTSATWVGSFQGTPFTLTTGGGGVTAAGTSTATTANVTALTVLAPLLTNLNTTGAAPVFISQTLGGSQTIAITSGSDPQVANQGIVGAVNVFIGVNNPSLLLFTVNLNAGVAGNFMTTATVALLGAAPVEVTATFFPWVTGATTIAGITGTTTTSFTVMGMTFTSVMMGATLPNFETTGSFNLDASGNGTITLVSATRTQVCVGGAVSAFPCDGGTQESVTGSATRLTLNFSTVPEPGTLLLLGAGLVGLVAVGRRQRS